MDATRRAKWSLTGIAAFGAAVFVMIGLPGFVDDLGSWKRAIDQARLSNTDWTIWFLIALGFALVAVGPWVLPNIYVRVRAWRTGERGTRTSTASDQPAKPDNGGNSAHLQEVSRKLEEALGESASLAAQRDEARLERDRERVDKETLAKETTELRLAIQNRDDMLREAHWNSRHGHNWPVIPDLPLHDTEALRLRAQELRPALVKAAGQCDALYRSVLDKMRSREEMTGLPWLAGFIGENEAWRMGAAWRGLDEVLNYPQDIRRHLIGFCWNYSEAKTWLVRLFELLQWPSEMASDYERCREADKALHGELERLLARNSMQSVREQIQRVPDVDLPAWPVESSGGS